MSDPRETVLEAARELGFDVVGVTSVAPFERDHAALLRWLDRGRHAGMDWMARRPEGRSSPGSALDDALSVVTVAVNHHASAPAFEAEGRFGRVARYAWGRDYHLAMRSRLERLAQEVVRRLGHPVRARACVDEDPLLERAAAVRAGLGFHGKNTNLLVPRRGSWFLLGELLLDVALAPTAPASSVSCGACVRCMPACPTDAFVGAYELDAGRCISYLTTEHRGPIPRAMRPAMGAWVFGCDACQEVCPWNRFATETRWPELRPEAGVGPRLDLVATLRIATDDWFRAHFARTPLLRPKRRGLQRNVAVVARNVGATATVPFLLERVEDEREPVVRGAALWALGGLAPARARALADRLRAADPDEGVRDEAEALLAGA